MSLNNQVYENNNGRLKLVTADTSDINLVDYQTGRISKGGKSVKNILTVPSDVNMLSIPAMELQIYQDLQYQILHFLIQLM